MAISLSWLCWKLFQDKTEVKIKPQKIIFQTSSPLDTFLIIRFNKKKIFPDQSDEKELPMNYTLRVISRGLWLAQARSDDPKPLIVNPPRYVMVSHTVSSPCIEERFCKNVVLGIQANHLGQGFGDIGYNFLIGGDGFIYEGRGWGVIGAHTLLFNSYSIGVAFIGNYVVEKPSKKQLDAFQFLLDAGVELGKLDPEYKILFQRQVTATESPGGSLIDILKNWSHWSVCDADCEGILKSKMS